MDMLLKLYCTVQTYCFRILYARFLSPLIDASWHLDEMNHRCWRAWCHVCQKIFVFGQSRYEAVRGRLFYKIIVVRHKQNLPVRSQACAVTSDTCRARRTDQFWSYMVHSSPLSEAIAVSPLREAIAVSGYSLMFDWNAEATLVACMTRSTPETHRPEHSTTHDWDWDFADTLVAAKICAMLATHLHKLRQTNSDSWWQFRI